MRDGFQDGERGRAGAEAVRPGEVGEVSLEQAERVAEDIGRVIGRGRMPGDGDEGWQGELRVFEESIRQTTCPCPRCGEACKRTHTGRRELLVLRGGYGARLRLRYGKHFCRRCGKYFSQPMRRYADDGARYGRDVKDAAMAIYREKENLGATRGEMRRMYGILLPVTTLHDWV